MSLTTNPFHPITGDLLPGYRDAYLRGDLSSHNTQLVDSYLQINPVKGKEVYHRFHALQATGHHVRPVGWMQQQFDLLRTEPARFRRRAAKLVLGTVLGSSAVFASVHHPARSPKTGGLGLASLKVWTTTNALRIVSGRILDERGRPLIGATVLDKTSGRGVGTDAQGHYMMTLLAGPATDLQFGYGGYKEEEARLTGSATYNVTLQPHAKKTTHHWWSF